MIDYHYVKHVDVPARLGIDAEQWRQHLLCSSAPPSGFVELDSIPAYARNPDLPVGDPMGWPWMVRWHERRHYAPASASRQIADAAREGSSREWDDDPDRYREFWLTGWCRVGLGTVRAIARSVDSVVEPFLFPLAVDAPFSLASIEVAPGLGPTITANELWFRREEVDSLAAVAADPHATKSEALDARERSSVYMVIGAMAALAKLSLDAHYKAALQLQKVLAEAGIDLSQATIAKHLKAADTFLRDASNRWPPSQ